MSTPVPVPKDTPSVLLFGHSGAGKSALLGAMLKAAETQGPILRGEVLEASGRLASIRDSVYKGNAPEPNAAELATYTVRLRPWREGSVAVTEPVTITLNDCSGKAAESLIHHPEPLRDPKTHVPVARAVIDADAIILLVNGAADDEELLEAFEEFDTFLTVVAQGKANAREVGGFPVMLVLTQSDRLARAGDTPEMWEHRVALRADEAWTKFDRFLRGAELEDGIASPFLPFGDVDLRVYSVAIRTPRFADASTDPNVPYKVAELFRDCFTVARSRRDRVKESDYRLKWTVRFALAFIGVLLMVAIAIIAYQPPAGGPGLVERIQIYERNEPEAAVRLAYPMLTRNKQLLLAFQQDSDFLDLPIEMREFVNNRVTEIEDYEAFRERLMTAKAPGDARTLEELEGVRRTLLEGDLALPEHYAWGKTSAATLREKWLVDVDVIRAAESEFLEKYRDLVRRGTVMLLRPSLGGPWRAELSAITDVAARIPIGLEEPLAGSPALEQSRGQRVARRAPFEFERVYNERSDWETVLSRLLHLRDLGDALGLTAGDGLPPAVLRLPEPGAGVDSATLAGARLAGLFKWYPRETQDYREWEVREFPNPVRSLLSEQLNEAFRTGVRHVDLLMRARIDAEPSTADTPQSWRALAQALRDTATPFPDWARLLHLIARLADPSALNPIEELAQFLKMDEFELKLNGFELLLQPDPALGRVTPAGPFTLKINAPNGTAKTRSFQQVGDGVQTGSAMNYRFKADSTDKLLYKPGDELYAELPVRAGGRDFKLVWETSRSRVFQFDKLTREPRMAKPGAASELAPGVRLTPGTDSTLPRLPILFPTVNR